MYFIKIGVDYRATPLEIREKLTFSETDVEQAMLELNKCDHVFENMILSTCNRTEVFAVVDEEEKGKQAIISFFVNWFEVEKSFIEPHLTFAAGEAAIRHAYRLVAGLESMVLGETQILGQMKQAFLQGMENNTTGKRMNELLHRVITFGKWAHSETVIGELAVSVSYVAVELSKNIFGNMEGKHAVILGAGDMGEASLKNLHGAGVTEITILNRSFQNAEILAERFGAAAVPIEQLDDVLSHADILISSTGANEIILTKERVAAIQKKRAEKPLFLIDIAVPRDIEESVAELENIYLYDTDDLRQVADKNMEKRKEAAVFIEKEIDKEMIAFAEWLNMLDVVPIIQALQAKSHRIQETTLHSIERKIPDLDERELKVLQKHTKSIITQLLNEPLRKLKQMGIDKSSDETKTMFIDIFGLEDKVNKNNQEQI